MPEPTPPVGHRKPFVRKLLLAASLTLGVVLIALLIGFFNFISQLSQQETEFGQKTDAVIALTGGSDRITDALAVIAEQRAKRLLITGVGEKTHESELIRRYGHAELFECCIDIDRQALNTEGNAIEAAHWIKQHGYRSVLVVTSNYHMPRALLELRRYIHDIEFVPHPVISESTQPDNWWNDLSVIRLIFSEYLKYLAALVRDRLVPVNIPRS